MMAPFAALVESNGAFLVVYQYASAMPLPPSTLSQNIVWQGVEILLPELFSIYIFRATRNPNSQLIFYQCVNSLPAQQLIPSLSPNFQLKGKHQDDADFCWVISPIGAKVRNA